MLALVRKEEHPTKGMIRALCVVADACYSNARTNKTLDARNDSSIAPAENETMEEDNSKTSQSIHCELLHERTVFLQTKRKECRSIYRRMCCRCLAVSYSIEQKIEHVFQWLYPRLRSLHPGQRQTLRIFEVRLDSSVSALHFSRWQGRVSVETGTFAAVPRAIH